MSKGPTLVAPLCLSKREFETVLLQRRFMTAGGCALMALMSRLDLP